MEFLTLLGLIIPMTVILLLLLPKRRPPDYDWKSCVKRMEEEEKRKKERLGKLKEEEDDDWDTNPIYADINVCNVWNGLDMDINFDIDKEDDCLS